LKINQAKNLKDHKKTKKTKRKIHQSNHFRII